MLIKTQRLTFAAPVQIGGRMWETISDQTSPHLRAVVDTISKDIIVRCDKTKTAVVTTTANCRSYYPQGIFKGKPFEKLLEEVINLNEKADADRQGKGLVTAIPQRESFSGPG